MGKNRYRVESPAQSFKALASQRVTKSNNNKTSVDELQMVDNQDT